MNYPEELTREYDIYEQIGAGSGMYRAYHKSMYKDVVLKRIVQKLSVLRSIVRRRYSEESASPLPASDIEFHRVPGGHLYGHGFHTREIFTSDDEGSCFLF